MYVSRQIEWPKFFAFGHRQTNILEIMDFFGKTYSMI